MIFHVYVIGPTEGFPCKIGVAGNIEKRLCSLQTGSWERLYIHAAFVANDRGAAYRLESLCKHRLSDRAMTGEWFSIFTDDAVKTIEQLCIESAYGTRVKNLRLHAALLKDNDNLETSCHPL
jgi:hypothetical protein